MNNDSLKDKIMERISTGKLTMRPRWHFVLVSVLLAFGALIILLALVYTVSLVVFFLRESGAWFTPSFGMRGWSSLLRSLPWVIILLLGVFVLLLELLVRRYSFVYKKPLLASVLLILAVVCIGGFAVSRTPLHRQLSIFARHGILPPPLDMLYRPPFHMRADEVYRGVVIARAQDRLVLSDRGEGTSTVIITPRTRLPYGSDFEVGVAVVVVGDRTASGTIEAFGIREIENEDPVED